MALALVCSAGAVNAQGLLFEPGVVNFPNTVAGSTSSEVTITVTNFDPMPVTVTATSGGSGNPVVFSIDPASDAVCTVNGSTVSFIGVGECTIQANQAGNATFEAAPQAQQVVTVSAAPPAAFVQPPSM